MAIVSIEEAIIAKLVAGWGLVAPLTLAEMKFNAGWYVARDHMYPQVSVSFGFPIRDTEWFGEDDGGATALGYINRDVYLVNCWYRVPAGVDVGEVEDYVEAMRKECFRILTAAWNTYGAVANQNLSAVRPRNRGRDLSENAKQPRILRNEIELQVNVAA